MRSETQMMDMIIQTAENDERIRAVILNGSRANPNVKKDLYQDFDIIYFVKEMETFTSDHSWVDRFGERIMMQMPEDKGRQHKNSGPFVYLMWFKDGNRIDLTLLPYDKAGELLKPDSLSILLLDKDGIIGELPPASDKDYLISRPSEKEFDDICNEFWWISLNIGKGLCRGEISYVMAMYEQINRNVLIQMLKWHIGIKTGFSVNAGKFGKFLKSFLEKGDWDEFLDTYTNADIESIWESLFKMGELFRKMAAGVAERMGFTYPYQDDQNVNDFLRKLKNKRPL